jgi:hypothetical protein
MTRAFLSVQVRGIGFATCEKTIPKSKIWPLYCHFLETTHWTSPMCGCQYVLKPQVVQAPQWSRPTSYRSKSMSQPTHGMQIPLGRNPPLMESHVWLVTLFSYTEIVSTSDTRLAQFWVPIPTTKRPTTLPSNHINPSLFSSNSTMFRCPTLPYPPIEAQQ